MKNLSRSATLPKKAPRGYLMLLALIFGAVFITVFGGLMFFVLSENRLQSQNSISAKAFALAEAGLEYYKWHLAHYPNDTQNGTGSPGPYVIAYDDPEAGTTGTYTLTINGNESCGQLTSVDIVSTGASSEAPTVSRTVSARYARPSVGTYSYILNADVWAGSDRVILGPYHSNFGIRMDGTANSSVSSSISSWNCTSSFGCSPAQPTAPRIIGSGPNQNLWVPYAVPQVDFGDISANFGDLKTLASAEGLYYPRYSTSTATTSPAYWNGYRITFNANDTITVRRVSNTTLLSVTPVNSAESWNTDRALVAVDAAYETRAIPADCGLIFVEDNVWVEGTIPSKVTLVVADVVNANVTPNAYLRGNIQYEATDGSDGFTLIAENNVLIAPNAPSDMTLNGIFIAQGGAFGMNAYLCASGYAVKDDLVILGTTVSNKRTGTQWTTLCSGDHKGFQSRVDSYDTNVASDPPPFTPVVSNDYQLIEWREE